MSKKYWLNFIEEGIMNPLYNGYVKFRIEINTGTEIYAIDEIHCLTKRRDKYYKLREEYDMKTINGKQLKLLKDYVDKLRGG